MPAVTDEAQSRPKPRPADPEQAKLFRLCRDTLGLTSEELAVRLAVGDRTLRRWESAERDIPGPAWVVVDRLLQEYQADLQEAIGKFGTVYRPGNPEHAELFEECRDTLGVADAALRQQLGASGDPVWITLNRILEVRFTELCNGIHKVLDKHYPGAKDA